MSRRPGAIVFPPESGEAAVMIDEVLDGDTVQVCFLVEARVRLVGVNAPETRGPERPRGLQTKARLAQLLPAGSVARAVLHGREKYGRLLADLHTVGSGNVAQALIREGLALPWDGLGVRPVAPAQPSHPLLGEPE